MRVVHLSTIHQALDVRIFMKECRTLAAHGWDVHLVIQNPPTSELDGVKFWDLNVSPSVGKIKQFWQRYTKAWEIAFRLKGQIYHFHDPELILLGLFLKIRGFQVIYDVHEDAPREAISLNKERPIFGLFKSFVWQILETLAKLFLDAFVCVTPSIKAHFPDSKSWLVLNFPLTEELKIYQRQHISYSSRENLFVYAGGITKIRGIREMVEALSQLPAHSQARLILLGTFSPASLETEIQDQAGWPQVSFRGWQSRHEMIQQVSQSKVGLVLFHPEPDHLEAIPNKLFEYMSAGLPVIASNFPWWRQLITELNCGLVVDPLDPKAIAEAMQFLLEHPQVAEEMGRNGQRAVVERFNWESETQNLIRLYDFLATSKTHTEKPGNSLSA